MDKNNQLVAKKPVSIFKKPFKVDFKDFFKALGKGVVDALSGNPDNLLKDVLDGLVALGKDTRLQPEEITWLLIHYSLIEGFKILISENHELMGKLKPSGNELDTSCQALNKYLDKSEISIGDNFFNNPKQISILEEINPYIAQWLENFVETESQAQAIANRLPCYFALALHDEWRRNANLYELIKVDSPFAKIEERERDWLRYLAFLQKTIEEPMFEEAFGLKQVYVPVRAYFVSKKAVENTRSYETEEKHCVDLGTHLETWLNKADPNDAIRIISGGPGSGKSSFTKVFAAKLAENYQKVLFIPLHQFNLSDDLVKSVGKYFRDTGLLGFNPLEPEANEPHILIIFDGLDELEMQGKWGAEAAQHFVRDISRTVELFNSIKMRLQVLISGREIVVQSSSSEFTGDGQTLHIFPYFIPIKERYGYTDPQGLLQEDQRDTWWKEYSVLSNLADSKLPNSLKSDNLIDITGQPLLNYLVALSYVRGKIDFSNTSNLNEVYADLLDSIHQRTWEKKKQHLLLKNVSQDNFTRILEEIAISAWHGNSRTTTVQDVERNCNSDELKNKFSEFTDNREEGITRLLIAFYFRKSDSHSSLNSFEFTHKSFGEYLTSKRIVRQIKYTHQKLNNEELIERWDKEIALYHWVKLCGSSELDKYIYQFIRYEIALQNKEVVEAWQKVFCQLIEYMLDYGMPMELSDPRPNYQEECRQARNAEETLLATVSACAWYLNKPYKISWPNNQSFKCWLGRMQDFNSKTALVASCLNHLDLSKCLLQGSNLVGADLQRANLQRANLQRANLQRANLQRANLQQANLQRADLKWANLKEADLKEADLKEAEHWCTNGFPYSNEKNSEG